MKIGHFKGYKSYNPIQVIHKTSLFTGFMRLNSKKCVIMIYSLCCAT